MLRVEGQRVFCKTDLIRAVLSTCEKSKEYLEGSR